MNSLNRCVKANSVRFNENHMARSQSISNARVGTHGEDPAISVPHTRDATATTLLMRVERAAEQRPHVCVDLTGDICRYATSAQALDLLLLEQIVSREVNPTRILRGLAPIQLSYALPESPSLLITPGLVDLANLGLHHHLHSLSPDQQALFGQLAKPATLPLFHDADTADEDEDETAETGETTLFPIIRLNETTTSITPLVLQVRQRLRALIEQGLPGIDTHYVHRIVTFLEESASNVREHAGTDLSTCVGFIAANRTIRRYRDRERAQLVEVYTTYVSCYDLGQGILAALASVPAYAAELASVSHRELGLCGLRLAMKPGVSSTAGGSDRGDGLPHMVQIVRDLDTASETPAWRYRGALRIISDGAILDTFTTTVSTAYDRVMPGVQLHLRLEAIHRRDVLDLPVTE